MYKTRYFAFYYMAETNSHHTRGMLFLFSDKFPSVYQVRKDAASTAIGEYLETQISITGFNEFESKDDYDSAQSPA